MFPALALFLGTNPELAHKEIEACATILPFPWSTTMLRPGILQLKSSSIDTPLEGSGNPLQQLLEQTFLDQVQALQLRLGGTVKIAALVASVDRRGITAELEKLGLKLGRGQRFTYGLSCYGFSIDTMKIGLTLKKLWKKQGLQPRFVPAKEKEELNSAQIFHNKLDLIRGGHEFVLIATGEKVQIGITLTVQDIDAYTKRDMNLPAPDPVSGMLPPKLAQILINLAVGGANEVAIYDPFCGNGRIVLEATGMGLSAFGSDIERNKVSASRVNLNWVNQENGTTDDVDRLWVQDARDASAYIEIARRVSSQSYVIAGEPYLGPPLRALLKPQEVKGWLESLTKIYLPYLETWSKIPQGTSKPLRQVLIFPSARIEGGGHASLYAHLVDTLDRFRYGHSIISHYARPDAIVGRDIVLLEY